MYQPFISAAYFCYSKKVFFLPVQSKTWKKKKLLLLLSQKTLPSSAKVRKQKF